MKRTYNLDPEVVSTVRREVEEGAASSQDAFVAAAILNWARELREAREALRWSEAGRDAGFQREAADIEQALAAEESAAWER